MTIKKLLLSAFDSENQEQINSLLPKYSQFYSTDFERFSIWCNYYLKKGEYSSALNYAIEAVSINPYHIESNYNIAYINELLENYVEAYTFYYRLYILQKKRNTSLIENNLLQEKLLFLKEILNNHDEFKHSFLFENLQLKYIMSRPFNNNQCLIGNIFFDDLEQPYYVGCFHSTFSSYKNISLGVSQSAIEILHTPISGTLFEIKDDGEFILPMIASPDSSITENVITVTEHDYISTVHSYIHKTYEYLRITGPTTITTTFPSIFSSPIPLKHSQDSKKLVLNIFIDSLNWRIFELYSQTGNALDGMKTLMPYTYNFFKQGTICTNAYTNAEWTTPTLPSYWTGCHSTKHMSLDENVRFPLSRSIKFLSEYFQDAGYFTANLNGNDAFLPTSGFLRGFDRTIYQEVGYNKDRIISDAIDQLEAFKECDQFVLLQFEDLHEVAGNFLKSLAVQSQTSIRYREIDSKMQSTVKSSRSLNKQEIYVQELKNLDLYLNFLYTYVQSHYSEEDYIISFFSDHGTAFLVDDDEPIICKQRMHIPLMFRSSSYKGIVTELVQNTDYAEILCKMCNIKFDSNGTDSNLPVFWGGKHARKYVFAQSIFIGDPYQAAIINESLTFYFKTIIPIDSSYMIDISDVQLWITDNNNQVIKDDEKKEYYKLIVLNQIKNLIKYI